MVGVEVLGRFVGMVDCKVVENENEAPSRLEIDIDFEVEMAYMGQPCLDFVLGN